ncbi:MAG: TonB-dependent receptor [Acidobacteria bacterium]|nr:TonB-dependent receptor [Acidobacteriota bacterium]MBI3473164.1 TonB-dependent receptor [Candidatus Solibacter usitatus]
MFIRLVLVLASAVMVWAQTDRANVVGTVTDQSGAVVAGAKVKAVHVATNAERSTVSSAQGDYNIPQLPVGQYRIEFEASGFKTYVRQDVVLTPGTILRVDAALTLGQVNESVEVLGQAPLVSTDSARVNTAVTPKFVQDLPLVVGGQLRSPLDLSLIAPETKNTYNISIGGGQEGGWDLSIDGISATPAAPFEQRLWTMVNSPSVDAVQEFAVDTNGFKAEFGHAGGGGFAFVSKSGTNAFHGNAYEFLRNNALDANKFFNNANNLKRAIYKQHDFGGTVGGPIWIPKVYNGKDKTFFFVSYEAFRNRTGAPTNFYTVPLAEMYQGDFRNWKSRTGALIPIYDPDTTRPDGQGGFTRTPFANNSIPQARFSTVAKNVIPLATMRPNTADPSGVLNPNPRSNFLTTIGARTDPWDKFSVKGDHNVTQNNRVGFMFQKNRTQQLAVGGTPPGLPEPLNQDFQYGDTWTRVYRGTYDKTLSPTLLNHFAIGFNDWGQVRRADDTQYLQGWGTKLGIKNSADPDLLFPGFRFDEYSPWGRSEYGGSYNKTFGFSNDLTWSRGSHNLKFGFIYQNDHYNGYGAHTASGNFSFSRQATSVPLDQTPNSGNAFASFLLGQVSSAALETTRFVSDQWHYYSIYAQDDWRVNRKLTLSYGIRWEYVPPTIEGKFPDGYSNFDPTVPNPAANGRLGAMVYAGDGPGRLGRRTLYDGWPYGFGPRLGAAYTVNDKTVLRASIARSFGSMKNTGGSSHFQGYIGSFSFNSTDGNLTPAFKLDDGYTNWPKPPFLVPNFNNDRDTPYWQSYDAGRLPEYYSLNLNVQRQLSSSMVLELGYSGSLGHHLATNLVNVNQINPNVFFNSMRQMGYTAANNLFNSRIDSPAARAAGIPYPYASYNPAFSTAQALRPYPQFRTINTGGDGGDRSGNSTYHALVVKWEKRYSSGLSFLNSYVFSKFFTDSETLNAGSNGSMDAYNRRLEKSLSRNDLTHNFKFSYSYELPIGKGKKYLTSGALSHVVGNWRIAGIHVYNSGAPMQLFAGFGFPIFANSSNRPTVLDYNDWRGATAAGNFDPNKDRWFNLPAFNAAQLDSLPSGTYKAVVLRSGFGTMTVRNPKQRYPWNLNESISLARTFKFGERISMDIRGEAFNLFNRVVWGGPDLTMSSNNFGRVLSQANDPRQLQLGAKIQF